MSKPIKIPMIQSMIIELRGRRVILDSDLAMLYGVTTKALNQAVQRNKGRFPKDFMFKLSPEEWAFLRSQIVTANNNVQKVRTLPYVFTRNGANMVSAILKSRMAVQRSIQIMRAFSSLEEIISNKNALLKPSLDIRQKLATHSRAILHLFQKDKSKGKQIEILRRIQDEVVNLFQQMVISSIREEK